MIRRTLGQVRPALTQVAGSTGMSISDTRFIERLNQVQEMLANEGDWPGICDRFHLLFDEITGVLVLPYYLDRLLQVSVDYCPSQIMAPYAEFVNYGAGIQDDALISNGTSNLQPRNWYSDCMDRGEVVSHLPVPPTGGPWYLRCYATEPEADGAVVNLQGWKDNRLIRSQPDGTSGDWINGVNLGIDFDVPYTESTQSFDKLSAVIKPETNGYIRITATDGTSEVELSQYAPVETAPSYRSYYIRSLWRPQTGVCNRVVLGRVRRRFVPVAENDDVLMISNINALKSGMISLWKLDAGDYEAAEYQKAQAIRFLQKEAVSYLGKSPTPALTFTRGFPVGAMPWVH